MTEDNFWDNLFDSVNTNNISIIHSPLKRAKLTCKSLVPSKYHDLCIEKEFLREAKAFEYVIKYTLGMSYIYICLIHCVNHFRSKDQ